MAVDYTRCAYHALHDHLDLKVRLSDHRLKDIPQIPAKWDLDLSLTVYDWSHYSDDTFSRYDFCPAQDAVSYSIDQQGIWEGYETLAVLQILDEPGIVVDVGAHVGWYCAIAAAKGHWVWAVEANPESANLASANCQTNYAPGAPLGTMTVGLVEHLELSAEHPARQARLFISDVEGSEVAAVGYAWEGFSHGEIDYAMLEMSPVFNDSYPALTQQFIDWGYVGFQVPHKGERLVDYGLDPLGVLVSGRPITPEIVAGWRQESAIFVAPEVFTLLTW